MGTATPRSGLALLLSAALLAGLMVVSAVAVGADDDDAELKKAFEQAGLEWFDGASDGATDEDDGSGVEMDALQGLAAGEGGGDTSKPGTGNLNDPLAGGSGGTTDDADADADVTPGSDPGTSDGSGPTDPDARFRADMLKLIAEYVLTEVQATEERRGAPLTDDERVAAATEAARDIITFLQDIDFLTDDASGDPATNELLKQIEGIPAEPHDSSSKSSDPSETDDD